MASIGQQILDDYNRRSAKILDLMNRYTSAAMKDAGLEFGDIQRLLIKKIFDESVQKFYDAYTPSLYSRRNSIFRVLKFPNYTGPVEYATASDLYDEDGMGSDRSGGSLFDKVFMQGWHGGAESGPHHPAPGVPYYRKPPPGYRRWGRAAAKTKSPHLIFTDALSAAEGGEIFDEFKRIGQKHNDLAMQKVMKEISNL